MDYLTVLIREINSLYSKLNLLKDLPCIVEPVVLNERSKLLYRNSKLY